MAGGSYDDGTPKNVLAEAYILPEYGWARSPINQYNQSNVPYYPNVIRAITANPGEVNSFENPWRDSRDKERDDFWISYIINAYQGDGPNDFDGLKQNGSREDTLEGVTPVIGNACDCLNSSTCPTGRIACSTPPIGAEVSLIYHESSQDVDKYSSGLPGTVGYVIKDTSIVVPHELSHQLGLFGDQSTTGLVFKIMDYTPDGSSPTSRVGYHPEHINLIRHRVRSPGRQ